MDKFSNHIRNIMHGFFLSIGTTIAEPSTILPLIVNYFGGSSVVVGIFASLLRGGAIMVQMFAAFKAQSYPLMLPYLRRVFLVRFLAWFSIGVAIILLGETHPQLTLLCIGIGLFVFSFSAGFGAIYFKDIVAKIFSNKFRGKTMAYRQFFTAFAGLISGSFAAVILEMFEAPYNFGYLFVISSFFMGIGFLAFGSVDELPKEAVSQRENRFSDFLKNSAAVLKSDSELQVQITTFLFAYGYLFALPFIILDAKESIDLTGTAVGVLITAQMVGAMFSNVLWGRLSGSGHNRLTANIALLLHISAIALAFNASTLSEYVLIFFLIGAGIDGNRIASDNLILILAPPEKRPVYVALQINIISLGLFFPILGGLVLHVASYELLYGVTLVMLAFALFMSLKLKDRA